MNQPHERRAIFPPLRAVGWWVFPFPAFCVRVCFMQACKAMGGASVICGSRERYDTFVKISGHVQCCMLRGSSGLPVRSKVIRKKWVYPNVSHVGNTTYYVPPVHINCCDRYTINSKAEKQLGRNMFPVL